MKLHTHAPFNQWDKETHLTRNGWGKQLVACVFTTSWSWSKWASSVPCLHLSILVTTTCNNVFCQNTISPSDATRMFRIRKTKYGCDVISHTKLEPGIREHSLQAAHYMWRWVRLSHFCSGVSTVCVHRTRINSRAIKVVSWVSPFLLFQQCQWELILAKSCSVTALTMVKVFNNLEA